MASRRRRRKTIGKVVSDVERRVRVVEKRPGAKRLKRNVVTAEKIQYRSIVAKNITTDGVTPNEVSFGTTVVTGTDPDITKEGTTVVDPATGAQKVYSQDLEDYVPVTDPVAQGTADGAATAAQSAYNAAIASLQPSASTIVNASNQITAVNTNGITVYSGASATTGARIVMNSAGIAGFDTTSTDANTGATFSISASTGNAVFKGSIQSGSTVSGAVITGGTIRTAASGSRIELASTASNRIDFWGSGTAQGAISANNYRMFIYAPSSTYASGAVLSLYGDSDSTPNGIFMTGGDSLASTFAMSSTNISLNQGTYGVRVTAGGVAVDGAAPAGSFMLRNAKISTSAVTSGDASGTTDGNLYLVREA